MVNEPLATSLFKKSYGLEIYRLMLCALSTVHFISEAQMERSIGRIIESQSELVILTIIYPNEEVCVKSIKKWGIIW